MNPQPMPVTLKQVIYPSTQVAILPTPDGGVVMQITAAGSGEMLILPMSGDAAREIGQKLCAPHVAAVERIPPMNGKGH